MTAGEALTAKLARLQEQYQSLLSKVASNGPHPTASTAADPQLTRSTTRHSRASTGGSSETEYGEYAGISPGESHFPFLWFPVLEKPSNNHLPYGPRACSCAATAYLHPCDPLLHSALPSRSRDGFYIPMPLSSLPGTCWAIIILTGGRGILGDILVSWEGVLASRQGV